MSEKLEVGSIVEGKIVRIKPFGAIVSLGSVQGLVHISQVANSFVQDINDHVKVGDIVKVKVLSIDEESHKIALSIRDALPKEERQPRAEKPFRKPNQTQKPKPASPAEEYFRPQTSVNSSSDFEDKMKEWAKQSNERHTSLNKRANKRSY
ncbi:S1 RNA-binding domain-containing protein [Anaerotignum sp. MB30-C6]|uniref:S1 RNA-binding domain-containing protein n=1 Tax=Anaerotignum sp. MB30-C6 TaxID=3070814 RepID=UPI0027DBA8EB|nr:S1 RNA-binding domain-containing protein [Anaerotignum sp. MB30-C6]WMI80518.1 S1 RNA-binding domain-containing protein [Anaerotignum sp. MB30-C6]